MVDPKYESTDPIGNLIQLQEECAETISECTEMIDRCAKTQKAVAKLLRFGIEGTNPKLDPADQITNGSALLAELWDLELKIARVRKFLNAPEKCPGCGAEIVFGYGLGARGSAGYKVCGASCGYFDETPDAKPPETT